MTEVPTPLQHSNNSGPDDGSAQDTHAVVVCTGKVFGRPTHTAPYSCRYLLSRNSTDTSALRPQNSSIS